MPGCFLADVPNTHFGSEAIRVSNQQQVTIASNEMDCKRILETGQFVSGADVEAEVAKIKDDDHPGPGDVIVRPKSRK
jgi:hypothetical protein